MATANELLSIGEVVERSGVAASALRFYEDLGLIGSRRSTAGHRLYPRYELRRIALIRIAQRMGLSLQEIGDALATLPPDRAPTKAQWATLSRTWRARLDERIELLRGIRDDLNGMHRMRGVSLRSCRLSNPDDDASALGAGPRYLLGDDPDQVLADAG